MSVAAEPVSRRGGQLRTGFTVILEALCDASVGALAATLVDEEGESVDLACSATASVGGSAEARSYLVKLSAAHLQIVARDVAASASFGGVRQLSVMTEQRGYLILALPQSYVMVLMCEPTALDGVSWRALRECEIDLCDEAGWEPSHQDSPAWRRVQVRVGSDGVPRRACIAGQWTSELEQVGHLASVAAQERGFRLRTHEGAELWLVREPSGHWYAERPLGAGFLR